MKLFIVVLCLAFVVAKGWQSTTRGRFPAQMGYYKRTNPDIVALFAELGEPMATAVADKMEALGIDVAAPITTVNPAKIIAAIGGIEHILVRAMVPAGCREALALHFVAGFGRHVVTDVLVKNIIHTVEECKEIATISHVAGFGVAGMGAGFGGAAAGIGAGMGAGFGAAAGMGFGMAGAGMGAGIGGGAAGLAGGAAFPAGEVPTMGQIDGIITAILAAIEEKLATITPAAGTIHIERFFNDVRAIVDIEAMKNKPVGEFLKIVAMMAKTHLGAFTGTVATCDVAGSFTAAKGGLAQLIAYMKGGFIPVLDTVAFPPMAKLLLKTKMTMTMGKVGDKLAEIVATYNPDNIDGFLVGFSKVFTEQVMAMHTITVITEEIMEDGKFMAFVQKFVTEGKTETMMKMILRMIAMTLADLDLDMAEIQAYFTTAMQTLTMDTAPLVHARFWWSAAAASGTQAVANVANDVWNWLG